MNEYIQLKTRFKVFLSLLVITISSCTNSDPEPSIVNSLPSEKEFGLIIESGIELFSFESFREPRIGKEDFATELQQINSIEEAVPVMGLIMDEPRLFLERFEKHFNLVQRHLTNNETYMKLSKTEQTELLLSQLDRIRLESKNVSSEDCPSDFKKDLERCHDKAMKESVACGILSPTLVLALVCAGFVIYDNDLCHEYAYEDFQECKKKPL